jgi:hypothetical protein
MGFMGLCAAISCKKDIALSGTDKELYEMAKETGGYTWFQYSSLLLDKSAGSGHPQPFLKTRYNAVAATQLDSTGRIVAGALFPEGSVVVKELRTSATTIGRYAVLYKASGHEDADARGWVWGYINADGTVAESASKKGSSCSGCHSQTDHIDYMLMNKYFPQ